MEYHAWNCCPFTYKMVLIKIISSGKIAYAVKWQYFLVTSFSFYKIQDQFSRSLLIFIRDEYIFLFEANAYFARGNYAYHYYLEGIFYDVISDNIIWWRHAPPKKSGPKYFCIKFTLSAFSPGILKIGKKLIYINFIVALIQEKVTMTS